MQKLKVNDEVIVLAGKEKGKKGNIANINWKKKKVFINGVNTVKKAIKPTQENPNGGFADVEVGLDISNVAVVSPKTGAATKVGFQEKDGKLIRIAKKCGSVLS